MTCYIFENKHVPKRQFWSIPGAHIYSKYNGKHHRVIVFGARTDNGKQLFRTSNEFTSKTFLQYLRELVALFGKKILIIMYKASQHRAGIIKEYLKQHKQIKFLYFPTGTPEINAVEQCWAHGKQKLLTTSVRDIRRI